MAMDAYLKSFDTEEFATIGPSQPALITPGPFKIVESTPQGSLAEKWVDLAHLLTWVSDLEDRGQEDGAAPNFKMVELVKGRNLPLGMALRPSDIDAIFSAFRIPQWLKVYAISKTSPCGIFEPFENGVEGVWAFFISIEECLVLWSYTSATASTRAIVLGGWDFLGYLRFLLLSYGDCSNHPLLMGLIIAIETIREFSWIMKSYGDDLTRAEVDFGRGGAYWHEVPPGRQRAQLLSYHSKLMAYLSKEQAQKWQLISITRSVLQLLLAGSHPLATHAVSWHDVASVAHCLSGLLDSHEHQLAAMEKRVSNQMTAIFNLTAQQDTQAGIELAAAAKRDSSSMKTLAVMTTAFLPATFLATVFAMPSLSANTTTGPRFGVYLAVAIPTTFAVILLWALLTQQTDFMRLLRYIRRGYVRLVRARISDWGWFPRQEAGESDIETASVDQDTSARTSATVSRPMSQEEIDPEGHPRSRQGSSIRHSGSVRRASGESPEMREVPSSEDHPRSQRGSLSIARL